MIPTRAAQGFHVDVPDLPGYGRSARRQRITQPTLILWGSEGRLVPLSVGEALHRGIARSAPETAAGCGHLAPAECAMPLLAGTVEF